MATAETVTLGASHPPKAESIEVFDKISVDLKKQLQHLRHSTDKHEPAFFHAVKHLSDHQLTNFTSANLMSVRLAPSAYGLHLFGKVLLPDSDPNHSYPEKPGDCYFMFRAFVPNSPESASLHCIRMQEIEEPGGGKEFKAIFWQGDELEWFDK